MAAPKASRARASLESAGGAAIGTHHAIIGVNAGRMRWGGARNRCDRVTDAITLPQARALLAAVQHAERADLPLNRLVTVHWGAMGLSDAEAGAALGRLLKLWREALAARGLPFAYVWVRENDDGDGSKGSHVHILAHVPAAAGPRLMRRLRGQWVRLAAGGRIKRRKGPRKRRKRRNKGQSGGIKRRSLPIVGPAYAQGAVNTRRIGGRVAVPQDVHDANLAEVLGYVLKGADKQTADNLGLVRLEPGGRVTGKRCGWSENVGAAARRAI